ncbi:MAG: acyl carrier protein [Bacteroidota bacterium]
MDQIIIKFITGELHGGREDVSIAPEDDLLGSGLVESMDMMRLIQFIEEEFELKVPMQDMTIENFMTVEAMVKYIEQSKN